MHDKKIMHRNLNTANILLTSKGVVKLSEFKLAKVLIESKYQFDEFESLNNSSKYSSPEIKENRSHDLKTDIWSLGVILLELCTLDLSSFDTQISNENKHLEDMSNLPQCF